MIFIACHEHVSCSVVSCMMVNSEQKTTDYLENNLPLPDHADMPHRGMSEPNNDASMLAGADDPMKARADWLFCIKRRGSMMRKLVFVMVAIPVVALIYFVVSNALSVPSPPQVSTCI